MNAIAPNLPPNYRLIIIERNEFVQHSSFVVRALVAPGTCLPTLLGCALSVPFRPEARLGWLVVALLTGLLHSNPPPLPSPFHVMCGH